MKKAKAIVLWAFILFLVSGVILYFPSLSSVLIALAAIVAAPIKPVKGLLKRLGIQGTLKGILVVVLIIAGAAIAPTQPPKEEPASPPPSMTAEFVTAIPQETLGSTPTPTPEPTPAPTPEPTPNPTPELTDEAVETEPPEQMVWISQTGSRYHRNASCSGMEDPQEVTITQAQSMGLTACGRCW